MFVITMVSLFKQEFKHELLEVETADRYVSYSDEETVKEYVDRINESLNLHINSYRAHQRYISNTSPEFIKPDYQFMYIQIGPKPAFDHSKSSSKEYMIAHQQKVAEWRQRFDDWAENNPEVYNRYIQTVINNSAPAISAIDPDFPFMEEYNLFLPTSNFSHAKLRYYPACVLTIAS